MYCERHQWQCGCCRCTRVFSCVPLGMFERRVDNICSTLSFSRPHSVRFKPYDCTCVRVRMSAIPQTDSWIEFFRMYRQLPALWKVLDEVYKNKRLKKSAYAKLLLYYQKIDPQANVDSMRRRMNGIRTCFRRELRKVEQSELTSNKTDEVYVPHLWYFNELSFLRGYDSRPTPTADVSDMSDITWNDRQAEDGEEPTEEFDEELEDGFFENETKFEQMLSEPTDSMLSHNCQDQSMPCLEQKPSHSQFLPQLIQNFSQNQRDEAAIYAEGWAISYRKLDEKNKLLAKKAIEEILVLGQLNKLEFNSVKMPQ